ncbi:MAG: valine--tRNA ligase [Candidatus Bipolaricaulota bacterium]|nr:valine--tRNA ligase [Candidatus Bipolaricaulota bacterium]MDW8031654.1 valine--tRNA ligase [Candidatus Bipolaricaulota bacterium]
MELPKAYDPKRAEEKWYAFWESRHYFDGNVNGSKKPFAIVIPPPNVTGGLHMGHALNNTLQDIVIRYKRMDGYEACWFPGTDHASIAVHVLIEKGLAKRELDDLLQAIGYPLPPDKRPLTRYDLGREYFVKLGWAWKERYGSRIREQLRALGCSCDWRRESFTLDEARSRAVIEVFVRLYEEGFIYRGDRLVNWCPRCQTVLSDLEVEREEIEGQLYYIHYPLAEGEGFITVATTRPETMLGDTGVAVHPNDERYQELIGKLVILPLVERKIPIIADEAVDKDFGTGAVKVTPAHDPEDFELGRRHGLKVINIFKADATTNENAGPYRGLDRYEARRRILDDLKAQGLLERTEKHIYAVGHCQRCHTVIEPLISTQWFVRMKELAEPAIKVIEAGEIQFIPERWTKVYFDWMRNIKDWPISRQLWWGHRIPAWHCAACKAITVARQAPAACSKCGSANIKQDEDVLDTWFSSALWPFSVMGWPEETPELKYFYPTQLLSTGHDIIFFWVARMIMMGLHFMGKIPFERVFFHPIIKDERGQKMSKSKGNVIDPLEMKEKHGMDALRLTLAALCAQGKEMRLSVHDIEGYKKFLNKLWNAARFSLMNLDGVQATELPPKTNALEDRWILSRLSHIIAQTRENLERYEFNHAAKGLYDFVWHDFCDWYLEMVKPRLYGSDPAAKAQAQGVLLTVLIDILKLLHPFIPFITEEIWQRLPYKPAESVMIAPYPQAHPEWRDDQAEQTMQKLQALITAIRTIRSEMNVPPQKKAKVFIKTDAISIQQLVRDYMIFFKELAQASDVVVGASVERPKNAPRMVLEWAEVFVPLEGLIDLQQEYKRLYQELREARAGLEATLRKLDNPEFLERAPEEVIEKEKRKAQEFKDKIERLEQNLKLLQGA